MVLSLTGCVSLTGQCVLESAILGGTFFIAAKGFITVDYQSIMKGMGLIAICVFFFSYCKQPWASVCISMKGTFGLWLSPST